MTSNGMGKIRLGDNMYRIIFTIIAATGYAANADIVRVDEFSSLQFEGFNDVEMKTFDRDPVSIFDGMAQMLNTKGSFLHTTGGWSFGSGDWRGRANAYEGSKMLGTSSGGVEYQFNFSQKSFGGFFATIANIPDAKINFYNGEILVGSDTLNAAVRGEWSWNGWSSDAEFDRVTVDSNYENRGGFLMHDAVRVLGTEVPTQGSATIFALGIIIATRRRR